MPLGEHEIKEPIRVSTPYNSALHKEEGVLLTRTSTPETIDIMEHVSVEDVKRSDLKHEAVDTHPQSIRERGSSECDDEDWDE